jgi:hypothetical protein
MNSQVLLQLIEERQTGRRRQSNTGTDRPRESKNKIQARKAKTETQIQKGERYREGGK